MRRITLSIAVAILGTAILTACDPTVTVTFVNNTDQDVFVSDAALSDGKIEPGDELRLDYLEYDGPSTFEALNSTGEIVFSVTLTWEQLKALDWIVSIGD